MSTRVVHRVACLLAADPHDSWQDSTGPRFVNVDRGLACSLRPESHALRFCRHADHDEGWQCPESCGKTEGRILPVVLEQSTTNGPPTTAATGGMRHGQAYQERARSAGE
jgi:hypothetical protein